MKPHRLCLTAFGAYPGSEVVDFDELAALGLFAVTGPTGAGKTTLFDAMAFALYGELPGDRPGTDVRSHHAPAGELCSVELTFSVEGCTYRVRRTPEQQRPKRRGTGTTTEAAAAELHRVDADGTEHPVAAGVRPVTDACTRLVGLDADQFERVVLLPQGKFQQFLLAGTKERRPLLQQLFGTALYRDAVEEMKRRAGDLRRRLAAVDTERDHHLTNAKEHLRSVAAELEDEGLDGLEPDDDIELLDALWQKLAPAVLEAQQAASAIAEEAEAATEKAVGAGALARQWDTRHDLVVRAAELAVRVDAIEWARARLGAARRAAPVVAAAADLDRCHAAVADADAELDAAVGRLRTAAADLGLGPEGDGTGLDDPDAVDRAAQAVRSELDRLGELLRRRDDRRRAVRVAERALAEVGQRRTELRAEQASTAELRARLERRRIELEPLAAEAAVLAARLGPSAERVDARRRVEALTVDVARRSGAYDDAARELRAVTDAFVAGAAPRLAATLQPGGACPVCGSHEHPAPATAGPGADVDARALEAARRAEASAHAALVSATTALAEVAEALGPDAERPLDELVAEHELLVGHEAAARAAAAELEKVAARIAKGAEHDARLQATATELAAEEAGAQVAVDTARAALAELDAQLDGVGPDVLEQRHGAVVAACAAVVAVRAAAVARVGAAGSAEQSSLGLATALAASGFPDRSAAEAAALPAAELAALERQVDQHDRARAEVDGGLAALAEVDLPDERPDVDALEATAAELREAAQLAAARVERLLQRGEWAEESLARAREVDDASTGLRELHERAERVAGLCDGQGPQRVGLETWVLAGELERVTEAANVHLARMTGGRYRLERTDVAGHRGKQAGLDLAVLDSHTGRSRAPATLSGGEQFQASLALALGLADVVSLGGSGSGRRFEALFVDEGFGSLDPEALDQAVDALHQIHASGRMVGVITHVEAMKQQLPTGIEVHRRADGRGSTLVPT